MKKKLSSRWSVKKPLYLKETDQRYPRHLKQLKKRGFSDAETWSLDSVIAEFILPRLKRFRKIKNGTPYRLTQEEWDQILDKMIYAFKYLLKPRIITKPEEKFQEGMDLFAKYIQDLWW